MKTRLAAVLVLLVSFWAANVSATEVNENTSTFGTVKTSLGTMTPQANTDLFSGAFTTGVDIAVPAGRRNIQPDLKLSYNSRGGSSWVGLGWNLSLATITRSLKHGIPSYSSSDDFLFSGQEMVSMGGNAYRLKKESSFMKYEKDTSNNRWTATDLNGTKYYFGSLDSSLFSDTSSTARTGKGSTFDETFQWYLVGVRDVFGNFMIITYQMPGNTQGFYYPSSIKYTGNDDHAAPYYEVDFILEARNDKTPAYTAGFEMVTDKRLHQVDILANGDTIRTYTLSYDYSPDSGHSLLKEVGVQALHPTETALPPTRFTYYNNSSSEKGWEAKDNHWDTPLSFGWDDINGHPDYGTRLADINGDGLVDVLEIYYDDIYDHFYVYAYQNTGMIGSDTLWKRNTNWETVFSGLNAGNTGDKSSLVKFARWNDGGFNPNAMRFFDINGDGLPDLVYSQVTNTTLESDVWLNTSHGNTVSFSKAASNWNPPRGFMWNYDFPPSEAPSDSGIRFGDVNGDGLPDMIFSLTGHTPEVLLNNSGGLVSGNSIWHHDQSYSNGLAYPNLPTAMVYTYGQENGLKLQDINGDGLDDFMLSEQAGVKTYFNKGNGNWQTVDGDTYWHSPFTLTWYGIDQAVQFFDINGDHQGDFLHSIWHNENWKERDAYLQFANATSARWGDSVSWSNNIPTFSQIYSPYRNQNVRPADVNGDGLVDLVLGDASSHITYLNKASIKVDLMVKIDNGQGVYTNISYKSSHNKDYLGSSVCTNDSHRLPNPMTLVDEVSTKMFDGSTYTKQTKTNYTYCGGYLYAGTTSEYSRNTHKSEFRGFGHVQSTAWVWDGSTYKKQSRGDTYFNQDRGRFLGPFVGTVSEQKGYVFDGATQVTVSDTQSSYTVTDIKSGSTVIDYSYSPQQDSYAYESGETIHTRARSEYDFDTSYALINKMRSIQDALIDSSTLADEKYTETEYSYQYTNWIQKIKKTWMTTESGWDTSKRLSEKQFLYDGNTGPGTITTNGLLTSVKELLTDTDPSTSPGGTYLTTWWAPNGASDYDSYGNLTNWMDFGVHKQFVYDGDTTATYPTVAITIGNTISLKVRTKYDYRFGKANYSQGPYQGDNFSPAGVATYSHFDGYGRTTSTSIKPVDGTSLGVANYTYYIRTCPDTGCTSSYWPVVKVMKEVYDGPTDGSTSTAKAISIYDCAGRVIQQESEASDLNSQQYQKVADTEYDRLGRKTLDTEPYFVQVSNGNTTYLSPSTYRGNTVGRTQSTYDNRSRLIKTELLTGASSKITLAQVEYGLTAHRYVYKRVTDADSKVTVSYQDIQNRMVKTIGDPGGIASTTKYWYDGLNNLVETQVNSDDPIYITYDSLSRKTAMDDPDMGQWQYTYDSRGNLQCQVDVGGQAGGSNNTMKTCYDYDSINRVTRKYYRNYVDTEVDSDVISGSTATECLYFPDRCSGYTTGWTWVYYLYDGYTSGDICTLSDGMGVANEGMGLGKLTRVCNVNNDDDDMKYVYGYDKYGRKKEQYTDWDALPVKMEYGYDRLDRNITLTYPQNGSNTLVLTYDYNNGGELRKVSDDHGNYYAWWGSTTERGYNARGQEMKVRYGNGTKNAWTYAAATGKLDSLKTFGPSDGATASYQNFGYSIDNVGNLTNITNNLSHGATVDYYFGNIDNFSYDNLHRLSQVKIHGVLSGNTYTNTYAYGYEDNGDLTTKTNYVEGVGLQTVSIAYDNPHQAGAGTVSGNKVFDNDYDENGNRVFKHFLNAGTPDHVNQYVYNAENKQVQVLDATTTSGTPTWNRLSDQFYHLDGSRMWEGIMDEGQGGSIQGQFIFDAFNNVRLTSAGDSFWLFHVYANGRRIATLQQFLFSAPGGCSLSVGDRLRFMSYPAIFANFGLLLLPFVLFTLIHGWFFDKSWRRKRAKNTLIVLLVVVFVFGLIPNLGGAQTATPDDWHLWMWTHAKDRLARMYGGEDKIPPIASAAKYDIQLYPPASGQRYILRDSFFWFAPDKMKQGFESIFPRAAQNDATPPPKREAKANLHLPWMASAKSDAASSSGGADTPVGQTREGASDVSHDAPLMQRILDALNDTLGTPRAQAMTWPYNPNAKNRIDFFHTDHLGSTRLVTDMTGARYEQIDYLPFGEIFHDAGPVGSSDYDKYRNKYTGQMWDYRTGLYYYGARYYDAQLGRFTQADTEVPKPEDAQTFNRYSYAYDNPYKYTDPSGHFGIIALIVAYIVTVAVLAAVTVAAAIVAAVATDPTTKSIALGIAISAGTQLLCMTVPGVSDIVTAYNLISDTIKAVKGDGWALASVVVSLAMVGYGLYSQNGSGSGSDVKFMEEPKPGAPNGKEHLSSEEVQDYIKKAREENSELDGYLKAADVKTSTYSGSKLGGTYSYPIESKPDPKYFFGAKRYLNIDPAECYSKTDVYNKLNFESGNLYWTSNMRGSKITPLGFSDIMLGHRVASTFRAYGFHPSLILKDSDFISGMNRSELDPFDCTIMKQHYSMIMNHNPGAKGEFTSTWRNGATEWNKCGLP